MFSTNSAREGVKGDGEGKRRKRRRRGGRRRRGTSRATSKESRNQTNRDQRTTGRPGGGNEGTRAERDDRREKIELNWGQIDSSRESLHSIWRLPNRVRLTPFKTFAEPSRGYSRMRAKYRAFERSFLEHVRVFYVTRSRGEENGARNANDSVPRTDNFPIKTTTSVDKFFSNLCAINARNINSRFVERAMPRRASKLQILMQPHSRTRN